MKNHKTVFVLFCLASLTVSAATWTIYPIDQDGMTPSQQLTNAVTRAANGDTVLFKPGTYQLDGASFMEISTSGSVTSRNYVRLTNKTVHFVGEAEGAWSDGVVLRGNGYDRFACVNSGLATFRNLTFENFAANDRPDLSVPGGNLDIHVLGGAIAYGGGSANNIVSNCVFRGNVARSAGALTSAAAVDCLFTNNIARSYGGGAVHGGSMRRCTLVANMATNSTCFAGAAWWPGNVYDCTFVGNRSANYNGAITVNTGMMVSNCVFRGNVALGAPSENYWAAGGGALGLRPYAKILDCVFEGNRANGYGGVVNTTSGDSGGKGCVFERCVFVGNTSGDGGGAVRDGNGANEAPLQFRDCTFSGNTAATAGMAVLGGAYSNCTFTGNFVTNKALTCGIVEGTAGRALRLVDCVVSNNYTLYGGLVRHAVCTNTLFYGNEVPHGAAGMGGVIWQCQATDCRFVGNKKYDTMFGIINAPGYSPTPDANFPSGDACQSTLVKCDMDLGCILNCVLVDCHIHTLTNKGAHCAFYGHNVATNCLIENCNPPDQGRSLVYRWGSIGTAYVSGSDYVNCTFADNVVPFMYSHDQEHGIYTPFKSCLFYNNRNRSGELVDTKYRTHHSNRPAGASNLDSGFALSNCVFGVTASPNTPGDTWRDLGGNKVIAPNALLVAGTRAAALGVHKYSLRAESPAIGMGDASMFTAADLDYAGKLRLRDGRLDPGCFECWLNVLGTTVIIR